jgi:hypothetical protein
MMAKINKLCITEIIERNSSTIYINKKKAFLRWPLVKFSAVQKS